MKHILIIDDDRTSIDCAKIALGDLYKLSTCSTGPNAIKFLETTLPDLLLLDVNMPFMDGFELIRRIRSDARTQDIPLVILTAAVGEEIQRQCKEAGALDYIIKPFVPSDLQIRMEQVFLNLEKAGHFVNESVGTTDYRQLDQLTGVMNAESGWGLIDSKIQAGSQGTLILFGADNLKAVNNNFGMTAGDNVIKTLADTIKMFTDSEDVLCRIGGDCFLIYVDKVKDKEAIGRKAKGIIQEMHQRLAAFRIEGNTSVSAGIAMNPEDGDNLPLLYNAADKALYHVKQNGKNSYHFFSTQSTSDKGGIASLEELVEKMRRTDVEKGAYALDYYAFQYVFNYLCRQAERGEIKLEALLLNLLPEEGYLPSAEEMEKAIAALDRTLFSTLRRSDVCARYSNRQMLLALPYSGDVEIQPVVDRIVGGFEANRAGGKIHLKIYVMDIRG